MPVDDPCAALRECVEMCVEEYGEAMRDACAGDCAEFVDADPGECE